MTKTRWTWSLAAVALVLAACTSPPQAAPEPNLDDPYLWLEEVDSPRALAWVRERNAGTEALLKDQPGFDALAERLQTVLQARDRVALGWRSGAHMHNIWTDANNPRGLWRRTLPEEYAAGRPRWQTVLDLDALGRAEGRSWVWEDVKCVPASKEAAVDRCLVSLSSGGSDAHVVREFDLRTLQFVPGGFSLPEAKSQVAWIDRNTVYVATDFGPGSLTRSGYPRQVRRWSRGQPLDQATTVFEGQAEDVYVSMSVYTTPAGQTHVLKRALDFYRSLEYTLDAGRLRPIPRPMDSDTWVHNDWLLLHLRSPLTEAGATYPAGSLLATRLEAALAERPRYHVLFTPTPTRILASGGVRFTRSRILLQLNENVASAAEELELVDGAWNARRVQPPGFGEFWIYPMDQPALIDDPWSEHYQTVYSDFLTPPSIFLGRSGTDSRTLLQQRLPQFDSQGMRVERRFATSRDGTRVPYFVVWPRGASASGNNPTLLHAYGGFQISTLPRYGALLGNGWLARGGVYVLANVRGGGEFGPAWHQAAIKEHRQRSFDDFIAVAEDLIATKVTSPQRLGATGTSNGGLLVAATLTQRPDLLGAAAIHVPVLDMLRYKKLLAGPSWVAEFGDPDDPTDRAYLQRYSPYHHVKAGVRYPRVLFTTSTRDDRVHPAHARKMAARMLEQGHQVLYYENTEGGHGGAADARQRAYLSALEFSYLWLQLGRPAR